MGTESWMFAFNSVLKIQWALSPPALFPLLELCSDSQSEHILY